MSGALPVNLRAYRFAGKVGVGVVFGLKGSMLKQVSPCSFTDLHWFFVVSPSRKECNFCARYCTVLWVGLASLKAVNLLYQACLAQPECLHSSLTTGPTVTRWGETNKTKATFKIHGRCFTYFLCVSITSGQRSMPLMSWWAWLILKSWKSPSQIQSYWQLGQLFWGHIDIYHSWQKTIYYDIPPTVVFEKITCTRWIVFSVDDVGASCICCAVVCSKVRSW